jgi:hypothetical protein
MARAENQVYENREVRPIKVRNEHLSKKMLKMKSAPDELLKTKGQKKCSG